MEEEEENVDNDVMEKGGEEKVKLNVMGEKEEEEKEG